MREERITVVVADDQAIVRDGLVTVLDLLPDVEVVGEASNGEEAVAVVAETSPDVALLDLRMPVLDGVAATARIAAEHPGTAVLVLTTFADDVSVIGALRAGARGYLTKDASRAEVAAAIRSVARGQTTLAAEVGARLIDGVAAAWSAAEDGPVARAHPPENLAAVPAVAGEGADTAHPHSDSPSAGELRRRHPQLTAREAEVLALVAQGRSNSEIATALFVGVSTVKTHINSLFAKLQVRDRAQAIALARR